MPPKTIKYKDLIRKLNNLGFIYVSQKGSHQKFQKLIEGKRVVCIVPKHKEITQGTLSSIMKQGFISEEEFNKA